MMRNSSDFGVVDDKTQDRDGSREGTAENKRAKRIKEAKTWRA